MLVLEASLARGVGSSPTLGTIKFNMPFLFVDYDQGAGGEYFCAELSKSPQCVPMESIRYKNGRTKVQDVFGLEFLKEISTPQYLKSDTVLYNIVPSHRKCDLAKRLLDDVFTLRISNPAENSSLWEFLKYQQINKVLFANNTHLPYFVGQLKNLVSKTGNKDFVKHVKPDMDTLTLEMMANGIEITDENRKEYLHKLTQFWPEPDFCYDLVIPYQDLFFNVVGVKQNIKNKFGIDINTNWLDKFKKDYDAYNKSP